MMKRSVLIVGLLTVLIAVDARSSDELLAVAMEEQKAFSGGDCDKIESLMDKEITFYANGRRMTHEQVGNFCRAIKRPFGSGRSPIEDKITPFRVSETLGYTVRDFRWENRDNEVVHEVVTKIWRKSEDGWKMIHFQSTVQSE
jgi:hypothetical protein